MSLIKKISSIVVASVVAFSLQAVVSPIPRNYKNFRQALNNYFRTTPSNSTFIITVSRENFANQNHPGRPTKNHIVSHDELKQILKLVYALCGRRIEGCTIPNYQHNMTALNIQPYTQKSEFHPDCLLRVDETCKAIEKFSEYNNMRDSCKIIVFDEMFFGQINPLTTAQKNFIQSKIRDISNSDDRAFFYLNFLYLENRNTNGINVRNAFRHMKRMKRQGIMNIGDEWFSEFRDIILATPYTTAPIQRNYLINETYCINNGNILTKYKKSSYFHESDDDVSEGAIYDFGNGQDEMMFPSQLGNILINRVSTEICLDLNCAIRFANQWCNYRAGGNQSSDVHIIQSNIIDPFDNDNMSHLPQRKTIIHSDAHYRRNLSIVNGNTRYDVACAKRRFCVTIGMGRYTVSIMKI